MSSAVEIGCRAGVSTGVGEQLEFQSWSFIIQQVSAEYLSARRWRIRSVLSACCHCFSCVQSRFVSQRLGGFKAEILLCSRWSPVDIIKPHYIVIYLCLGRMRVFCRSPENVLHLAAHSSPLTPPHMRTHQHTLCL